MDHHLQERAENPRNVVHGKVREAIQQCVARILLGVDRSLTIEARPGGLIGLKGNLGHVLGQERPTPVSSATLPPCVDSGAFAMGHAIAGIERQWMTRSNRDPIEDPKSSGPLSPPLIPERCESQCEKARLQPLWELTRTMSGARRLSPLQRSSRRRHSLVLRVEGNAATHPPTRRHTRDSVARGSFCAPGRLGMQYQHVRRRRSRSSRTSWTRDHL
jgi:hypothetical protein